MKHYWMTYCNDGVELFNTECPTRAAAIDELKTAFRFDSEESPVAAAYNDYYIEQYIETESEIITVNTEHFKLTIGKRGGIRCVKVSA